jgi:hypothetical protein
VQVTITGTVGAGTMSTCPLALVEKLPGRLAPPVDGATVQVAPTTAPA